METKQSKPIDRFVGDGLSKQFSRECLLWYYENVQQTISHPYCVQKIRYLMKNCPDIRKTPGLTIVLEASGPDLELDVLRSEMGELKATGYFDNINRNF